MATLNDIINNYNKRQPSSSFEKLKHLQEKYGSSYFSSDDVANEFNINGREEKRKLYAWIHNQCSRKIFYKVSMGPKNTLYRITMIPEHGGKLSKDEVRELNAAFLRVAAEAKQRKQENDIHKTEANKDLAYRLHKEDKYLPLQEEETLNIPQPTQDKPVFSNLEKVINPAGTVVISTKKEANKHISLSTSDNLKLYLKLQKDSEVITLSTSGTSIDVLRKLAGILESLK